MPAKRGRKSYADDRSRGFEVFLAQHLSADRQHSLRSIASLMANAGLGTRVAAYECDGETFFRVKAYGPSAIRKMLQVQLPPEERAGYESLLPLARTAITEPLQRLALLGARTQLWLKKEHKIDLVTKA